MNKRIQKLYDQADKFATENRTQTISGPGNNYFELFHEKFAELIVRECISTLEEKIYSSIDNEGDEIWADLILKEHFGVEE
jgi:hypothetical protein